MPDRVRPYKMERPAEGGTQTDENFTEVDIGQDYLDCAGVSVQLAGAKTSTADATTLVDRTAAGLRFTDGIVGSLSLSQLITSAAGKPASHNSLPDIIHWLADGGPGDGFPSGAWRQTTTIGILPATVTWYSSQSGQVKLYAVSYSYSGFLVSQIVRTLFANNVAVRTVTDTITYPSPFARNVTRTWT